MICFDFSRRFGAISSANILLEISKAKTTSTPSLLMVFNLLPIFGFVKEIIRNEIPSRSMVTFKVALNLEALGANIFNSLGLENFRCVLFFHHKTNKKITSMLGTMSSR